MPKSILKLLRILLVVLHLLHDLIVGDIDSLRRVSVFLQQLGDIGIKLILDILTIRPVCILGFIADQLDLPRAAYDAGVLCLSLLRHLLRLWHP